MSGTRDLRRLLDLLRTEVGPVPAERAAESGLEPPRRQFSQRPAQPPAERPHVQPGRPYRPPEPAAWQPERHYNSAWGENKETILFGLLTSLIAALGGVLAGLDYLVMTGTAAFGFFSLVMGIMMLRHSAPARRAPDDKALTERLDALSKRVETLSSRAVSGGGRYTVASADPELERKVEELRVMVKSLSRAVDAGNNR